MKKLVEYHDAPISTISSYVQSFITKQVSNEGYKVFLSGIGADEIFTGYYDHFLLYFNEIKNDEIFDKELNSWKESILPNIRNEFLRNNELYIKNQNFRENVYEEYYENFNFLKDKNYSKFSESVFTKNLFRNRMMNEMFGEVVPIILYHEDLNSMMFSIENRSPFLDKNLFEYSLTIPSKNLISNGFQKYLLREAGKEYLNEKILQDRVKKGFNASILSLNFDVVKELSDIKNNDNPINDLVDIEKVLVNIKKNKYPNHLSKFIFSIFSVNLFLQNT